MDQLDGTKRATLVVCDINIIIPPAATCDDLVGRHYSGPRRAEALWCIGRSCVEYMTDK
jgi:hypothetical protein